MTYRSLLPGLVALLALPVTALAHPGHGAAGFTAGLAHPWLGADHLLAMIAVGAWALTLGGRARWLLPATFVAGMAGGAALGAGYGAAALAEWGIAGSLVFFGVCLAAGRRLPLGVAAVITALFAVAHGHAHGAEAGGGTAWLAFGAGMVLATAVLHALGVLAGIAAQRLPAAGIGLRLAGGATAAFGAVALVGLLA
ncbi:HupE/UreJ family protein [Arhodomonas aquaeolei]|uniref:HupE/UreJ family protein n=1 Tax=Arhodomonas aquaeolei TaxID=2369 RepID=UPI000370E1E4|nr:HupE/UreJ family protein [Arhodomonas aquaeolei]MCS4504766.1 HupE/UreJ family protein [Arhodomonas aquaeolei]